MLTLSLSLSLSGARHSYKSLVIRQPVKRSNEHFFNAYDIVVKLDIMYTLEVRALIVLLGPRLLVSLLIPIHLFKYTYIQ